MSAITQASAQVAKTVAVTTGKVANAKSMMIWRPHGNKYVNARDRSNLRVSFARIAPHRANVARPLRARARLGDAARAIFRRRQFFFDVLTPAIAARGVGVGGAREGSFGGAHPIARSGTRALGYWVLGF